MMIHPDSFIGHHLAGQDPGNIDDWVERWHAGPSGTTLPAFLGMTEEEYANWVLAPSALEHIITIRRMVEEARVRMQRAVAEERGGIN